MGTIEEIIKTIDDKLIETGKQYLTLGQANQLLVSENVISIAENSNKALKKLLEENKIPHANQTESSPKQWRIPLSDEGKKRQKTVKKKQPVTPKNQNNNIYNNTNSGFNQVICPGCGLNLYIPPEIKNENYIQCLTCRKTFRNPLKPNSRQTLTKTQRNWLIGIAVVLVLWFIGSMSDDNGSSNSKVQNSEWDASVHQVKHYLKNYYLKDPDSYESIEWSKVNEMSGSSDYKYWVRHKYRAKNSFGGYVIENKIFYLDEQGNVVGEKDVY